MMRDYKQGFVRDDVGDFLNTHFLPLKRATGEGLDRRHYAFFFASVFLLHQNVWKSQNQLRFYTI